MKGFFTRLGDNDLLAWVAFTIATLFIWLSVEYTNVYPLELLALMIFGYSAGRSGGIALYSLTREKEEH